MCKIKFLKQDEFWNELVFIIGNRVFENEIDNFVRNLVFV